MELLVYVAFWTMLWSGWAGIALLILSAFFPTGRIQDFVGTCGIIALLLSCIALFAMTGAIVVSGIEPPHPYGQLETLKGYPR